MNNYDFSTHKFGCYSLHKIMSNSVGKSNREKIIDFREQLEAKQKQLEKTDLDVTNLMLEINSTKNKETATYLTKLERYEKLTTKAYLLGCDLKEIQSKIDFYLPIEQEEVLSETCKTYLKEVFIKYEFGKKRMEIKAKPLEKGIYNEQEALNMVCDVYNIFAVKNTKYFDHNKFIHGIPDVVDSNGLRDIKAPWDILSFRNAEITQADYWQGIAYCILTGESKCIFNKCLTNLPLDMLEIELRRLSYKYVGDELLDKTDELINSANYDNIPTKLKVKTFEVKYETGLDEKIYRRIEQCRKFLINERKEWGLDSEDKLIS
jgi:hypothetical protein